MDSFVSEPIRPDSTSLSARQLSTGLVSLPEAFEWRGHRYEIVEVLEHVKLTSVEGSAAQGDRYLRRQRFTVRLQTDQIAVIDFLRSVQAKRRSRRDRQRWFLYTISDLSEPDSEASDDEDGPGRQ